MKKLILTTLILPIATTSFACDERRYRAEANEKYEVIFQDRKVIVHLFPNTYTQISPTKFSVRVRNEKKQSGEYIPPGSALKPMPPLHVYTTCASVDTVIDCDDNTTQYKNIKSYYGYRLIGSPVDKGTYIIKPNTKEEALKERFCK